MDPEQLWRISQSLQKHPSHRVPNLDTQSKVEIKIKHEQKSTLKLKLTWRILVVSHFKFNSYLCVLL